ncbi:MAG: response regulator transcription factor [Thermoleophilia bacterium]|nr:response regulator transcription factor [Thermoleophilia bacterium]
MTVDEYEEIRSEPAHFAVLAGHEILECERVVKICESYLIVEKHGDAGLVADASDPRNHLKTCRVVIVDDIPEIRYLLKMLLAIEPSCTVVGEAGNGAEAITVIEDTQPELVVLDLQMPVMDGFQALPHIRRVSPSAHIIVFSSNEVDARLEKRLANLGADRFVKKGGDPNIIVNAIRDVALSGRDRNFSDDDGGGRHEDDANDAHERRTGDN